MKILFFTTDLPPLFGLPTNGSSLRAAGYIAGFTALGHEVVVSTPLAALDRLKKSEAFATASKGVVAAVDRLSELAFCHRSQNTIVSKVKPDVILCGHWPAVVFGSKPTAPLIVDLAGPHLLERHFQGSRDHDSAVVAKLDAVAMADLCVTSGPAQRRYFLSYLMRANVDHAEERLVEIPMLFGDPPLTHTIAPDHSNYPRIIFGGVFLPWQDPTLALQKTVEVLEKRGRGRLILVGGPHPSYDINSGIYKKLFDDLSKSQYVEAYPMLPLAEFTTKLKEADVALDLMRWNLERELAVTIRTTTYLWSGLPVIYNNFADLGATIVKYGAGWAAAPAELESILNRIIDNPQDLTKRSAAATQLATELFNAKQHCQKLLSMLDVERTYKKELDITLDFPQQADLAVTGDYPITQQFLSRVNGLAEVRLRVYLDADFRSSEIRIALTPANDPYAQPIAVENFTIDKAAAADWIRLRFDPVPDSAGRIFNLRIEQSENNAGLAPAIYPWGVPDSPYPLLALTAMGERYTDRALCMQTISLG